MIGVFYQPEAVIYDLELLKSLPIQEIRSGFAEVIKHALIADPEFYLSLKENVPDLAQLTSVQLSEALVKGIKIKNHFVSQDERETGVRAYLNFGHTLGHAIEAEMGYGNFTHGESVMIGMIFALKWSKEKLGLDFQLEEFVDWVKQLGYETKIPKSLTIERLVEKMKQDKKSIGESIRFVLLTQIGQPMMQKIREEDLRKKLESF